MAPDLLGDFGARDSFLVEIESNFAEKVLGNVDTEHKILILNATALSLAQWDCVPVSQIQKPLPEDEVQRLLFKVVGWRLMNEGGDLKLQGLWKVKDATNPFLLLILCFFSILLSFFFFSELGVPRSFLKAQANPIFCLRKMAINGDVSEVELSNGDRYVGGAKLRFKDPSKGIRENTLKRIVAQEKVWGLEQPQSLLSSANKKCPI